MNILLFRIIKITVFTVSFFIAAKITVNILKKRNSAVSISDPEIIATAVFFAAVITGIVSLIIKAFV